MRVMKACVLATMIASYGSATLAREAAVETRSLFATSQSTNDDVVKALKNNIDNVRLFRDTYSKKALDKRSEQTAFDSTLILAGIGSVAAALYRSSAPALGGIGLFGTGLSQYRSYYNPEGEGAAYLKAVKSARCVSSTAESLLSAQPQTVWNAMANLRAAIAKVQASTSQLQAGVAGAAQASDAATKAVAAANSALAALSAEASAYNNAPAVVDQAHDALKNFIDQANHRSVIDFGALQTALNNGITAAATSAAQTQTARTQLLDAVKSQAQAQAAAGPGIVQPAPQAAAPQNLAQAQAVVAPPPPSGAAGAPAVAENLSDVSALVAATEAALQQMPSPQFTTINTNITACTAGLT